MVSILVSGAGSVGLSRGAALAISELALTESETSWHTNSQWAPGSTVYVRVILVGLHRDEQGKIHARESLELRDSGGQLLLEAKDLLKLERDVPDEVSSLELVNHFVVPEGLAEGWYRAWVSCVDDVAGSTARGDLELVVGDAPGTGLRITQFTLSPARNQGGVAQAEARLVGYRLDPGGRFWIEADVVLIDPSGRLALRWDKVLEKRERSEPAGLPLRLSLQLELPEQYAAGAYRLELRVRDRLASQEVVQNATWTKR